MDITYNNICSKFLEFLKSSRNVSSYSSISYLFLPGQTVGTFEPGIDTQIGLSRIVYPKATIVTPLGAYGQYQWTYSVTIATSQDTVASVSASTVESEFNTFLGKLNLDLTKECTVNGMFYLLRNLHYYCCNHLRIATSNFTTTTYMVYTTGTYSPLEVIPSTMTPNELDNITRLTATTAVLERYIQDIRMTLRVRPVKYSYTLTDTKHFN